MKLLDISNYQNFLSSVKLNTGDVCHIIKNYPLEFPQTRNQKVEWEIAFPVFLISFYKFVYFNNNIPTQKDFFNYYLAENSDYFNENKYDEGIISGLRARVFRTYPSLVRDLHFGLYLKENINNIDVVYSCKLDVEEGIDLLLVKKGIYYGINLYTNTRRALLGREKKFSRHTNFDNVKYIELPVNLKGSIKCGKFFLYGNAELKQILEVLSENHN